MVTDMEKLNLKARASCPSRHPPTMASATPTTFALQLTRNGCIQVTGGVTQKRPKVRLTALTQSWGREKTALGFGRVVSHAYP